MNLLQMAPLCDSRGNIRYFIGAQIDVSGLAMEGAQMESLQNIQVQKENPETGGVITKESKSEFQELGELFSPRELQNVREHGGNLFQPIVNEDPHHRLFLQDSDSSDTESEHPAASSRTASVPEPTAGLSLTGVYRNVRFATPLFLYKSDAKSSTSSSAPTHPSEFSLHPHPSRSQECYNPPS
jgi:hypothetical protein